MERREEIQEGERDMRERGRVGRERRQGCWEGGRVGTQRKRKCQWSEKGKERGEYGKEEESKVSKAGEESKGGVNEEGKTKKKKNNGNNM